AGLWHAGGTTESVPTIRGNAAARRRVGKPLGTVGGGRAVGEHRVCATMAAAGQRERPRTAAVETLAPAVDLGGGGARRRAHQGGTVGTVSGSIRGLGAGHGGVDGAAALRAAVTRPGGRDR